MTKDLLETYLEPDPNLVRLRDWVDTRLQAEAPDPGHDLAHALRVARWTLHCLPNEASEKHDSHSPPNQVPARFREAIAAALLHDIVNLPKDSPERSLASVRSAEVARDVLGEYGFDAAAIDRIAEAIEDHSFSRGATPKTPLGDALQDADRLEALGALGIFRTVSCGVKMGGRYFNSEDPWAERRPLDDIRFNVDHFFRKLLRLPNTMRTERGRQEAESRADYMRGFLSQLGDELGRPFIDVHIDR